MYALWSVINECLVALNGLSLKEVVNNPHMSNRCLSYTQDYFIMLQSKRSNHKKHSETRKVFHRVCEHLILRYRIADSSDIKVKPDLQELCLDIYMELLLSSSMTNGKTDLTIYPGNQRETDKLQSMLQYPRSLHKKWSRVSIFIAHICCCKHMGHFVQLLLFLSICFVGSVQNNTV